ncbi:unnamed protein product [Euphydryas editha]|uniref:Uncharacterized protein n=1 Tax=Euphydryas editha TaxID=104508 RepID=A0AAU9UYN6_EUPED|nr:unnamed protein product [Euphydryas editha]
MKTMFNSNFEVKMTTKVKEAWISFKEVIAKFLGNMKDPNYELIVANMLTKFKNLGYLMSLKLLFLQSHLGFFPKYFKDVSEEQGEQTLKVMEKRY